MSKWFSSISNKEDATTSADNLFYYSCTLTVKKVFPDIQKDSLVFQFVSIILVLSLGTTESGGLWW